MLGDKVLRSCKENDELYENQLVVGYTQDVYDFWSDLKS